MHTDMTAVTIPSNTITLNEVKDNEVLLEPSYGKNQANLLASPWYRAPRLGVSKPWV